MDLTTLFVLSFLGVIGIFLLSGMKVVPQSRVYVVERFGKYTHTLEPGLSYIVPFIYRIAHKVSILERQLPNQRISVITKDNVEVFLDSTVFYRVVDASASVYRIQDIDQALSTSAISIIRSETGKMELDELLSSRENMNSMIAANLIGTAKVWGIDVTRSEILDISVDEQTKHAQRQQLVAERERRAKVAIAEGEREAVELAAIGQKRAVELEADADLYAAKQDSEAIRVRADANAYEVRARASAEAEQTQLIAQAINAGGENAAQFELLKRQIDAVGGLAASENSKTVVLPASVVESLGSLSALFSLLPFGNLTGTKDESHGGSVGFAQPSESNNNQSTAEHAQKSPPASPWG